MKHMRFDNTVAGALVRFDLKSKCFTAYVAPKGYDWERDVIAGRIGTLWATGGAAAQILHVARPLFHTVVQVKRSLRSS